MPFKILSRKIVRVSFFVVQELVKNDSSPAHKTRFLYLFGDLVKISDRLSPHFNGRVDPEHLDQLSSRYTKKHLPFANFPINRVYRFFTEMRPITDLINHAQFGKLHNIDLDVDMLKFYCETLLL